MKETLYVKVKRKLRKALKEDTVIGEKMNLIEGKNYKLYLIERNNEREIYKMNLFLRPSWNITWEDVERTTKRTIGAILPENMICRTVLNLFAGVNVMDIYIYKVTNL